MLDFILTVVGYGILALLGLPVYLMFQYSYWWGLILPPCWWLSFTVLTALDEPHTIKSDDETQ